MWGATYDITSLGDAVFLQQVLAGVAMITGTGDYMLMLKIGTILGLLVLCFQSMRGGGRGINFGEIFLVWLLYATCFSTTKTVTITDYYTGAVRVQAGIPLGVAAIGSLISGLGIRVTELMETAFSTPTMTSQGYGGSLEAIKTVRLNTISVTKLGSSNSPVPGSDVETSWTNYMKECTFPGIGRGVIDPNVIMRSADFMDALVLNSPVNGTLIYVGAGGQSMTCMDAFPVLANFTRTAFLPAFKQILASPLDVATGADVDAKISDALNGIGLTTIAVDDFIISSVLVPIYLQATAIDAEETFKFSYASMIHDAVRARDSQWLAGQSLFESYVRPVLTFLEAFAYAVTPIAGVVLCMGGAAVALVGRYALLLVWIWLWYPILAVVNLYLHLTVTGKMAALAASGETLTSFAGTLEGDGVISTYLAVGGLMAASAPGLSLFLLYGGSVVANSIAGQLESTATVNPEVAAPRLIGSQYSGLRNEALRTSDPVMGERETNAERIAPTLSFSRDNSRTLESARSHQESSSQEFRTALANSLANTSGRDERGGQSSAFNQSENAAHSEVYSVLNNRVGSVADSISKDFGISKQDAFKMGLNFAASGRVSAGGESGVQLSETQRSQIDQRLASVFNEDKSLRDDLTRSAAKDIRTSSEDTSFFSNSVRSEKSVSQAAARVVQDTTSFQEASRQAASQGIVQQVPLNAAVRAITSNPKVGEQLAGEVARLGLGRDASLIQIGHPDLERIYGSRQGAFVAAELMSLANLGSTAPSSELLGSFRRDALNRVLTQALPVGMSGDVPSPQGSLDGGKPGSSGGTHAGGGAGAVLGAAAADGAGALRRIAAIRDQVGGASPGRVFTDNREATEVAARHEAQPVADGLLSQDQTTAHDDASVGLARGVSRLAGVVGQSLSAFGAAYGTDRGTALVKEQIDIGRGLGLLPAQAEYYGLRAASGLIKAAEYVQRKAGIAPEYWQAVDAAEQGVRHEAVSHGLDPDTTVERLRSAATGVGSGDSERVLRNLAGRDRLADPSSDLSGPIVDAVREKTIKPAP